MALLSGCKKISWLHLMIIIIMPLLTRYNAGFALEIKSKDFQDNQPIPALHTCEGKDVSPQLAWTEAPDGTKSLALTCIDPDAPVGDFIHWLVYGIPVTVTSVPQGGPLPAGAKEVENDFGKKSYGGPCPHSGTHRYVFTIYALKTDTVGNITRGNFRQKIKELQIGSARIIGLYKRQ